MEHRLSRRIPLQQQAIVHCPRVGGGPVRIRDINLGGMLVDSAILFLPLHAPLTIAFRLENGDDGADFLLDAMVIRHAPGGAAIVFSELEADMLRLLHATLYPEAPRLPHYRDDIHRTAVAAT